MSTTICNYFAAANTARGFVNYFEDNVYGIDRIYILKGCTDSLKSYLIKNVGIDWFIKGYDIEYIHSSVDENLIEAVIIPALKTGVVNGDIQYIAESRAVTAVNETIYLEAAATNRVSLFSTGFISDLDKKIKKYLKKAHKLLQKALKIRDDWEKIYTNNISLEKVFDLVDKSLKNILSHTPLKQEGLIKNRFPGVVTDNGFVDFIIDLTRNVGRRHLIKDCPGPGKSIFLEKLANTLQARGFDVEVYHNCFDPERLDMIIVPELDLAVLGCTEAIEIFPLRISDEVIDISDEGIHPYIDRNTKEYDSFIKQYKKTINDSVNFLKKSKDTLGEIEQELKESIDLKGIDKVYSDIIEKIKKAVNL